MNSLVEKYKPTTIDSFVGLDRIKRLLAGYAADPQPANFFLLGDSGQGKTTMAFAFANAVGAEIHHIPSKDCNIERVDHDCNQCYYIPMTNKFHAIIVDEADSMSNAAQNAFLSKLDGTATPPATFFIFTGNSTHLLHKRFLSRCRVLRFTDEGMLEPGAALLRRIWVAEGGKPEAEPDFETMIRDSGFNMREAITELEMELIAPTPKKIATLAAQPEENRPLAPSAPPVQRRPQNSEGLSYSQIRNRAVNKLKAQGLVDPRTPFQKVPASLWKQVA